jgi:AraC family transcriptional regulator
MRPITQQDHMQRVARVVAQLQAEMDRTLSVGDIADIAALSPFHVIRVFRQITGYTPAAMQTALRVQAAKRLMIADRASVTDACFEVGFNSLGSFSQRFKELAGVSPSSYRNAQQRVEPLIEQIEAIDRQPWHELPSPASVSGRLHAAGLPDAFYFVGLFPPGPPRGRPIRGDARTTPGEFVIRHVPDGQYQIYSAVIARRGSRELVMPDEEIATGGGQLVQMRNGQPVTGIDITLIPRTQVITPITTTLFAIPTLAEAARINHMPLRVPA